LNNEKGEVMGDGDLKISMGMTLRMRCNKDRRKQAVEPGSYVGISSKACLTLSPIPSIQHVAYF
jgi:hypothetical protein